MTDKKWRLSNETKIKNIYNKNKQTHTQINK